MRRLNILAAMVAMLMMLPGTALALNTVLSGEFDGSESRINGLPGTCFLADDLGYREISPLQVSVSGDYTVVDAYNAIGVDISANLYEGNFDPASPLTNLLTPAGIDFARVVGLDSGTDYVLVVQHWCENQEGAWAVTFSGPGTVTSDKEVQVPEFTEGSFTNDDPVASTACGNAQYQQSGPIQVSETGTYYYSDISVAFSSGLNNFGVDMCLSVYSAPFDPANPSANRVGWFYDFGLFELEAGQDYYFVAQPENDPDTGEFFYMFAPPAPFRIQFAMAGSWYYPPTRGQGFFMDVFDQRNEMFVGWYTYDLERPDDSVTALMGDPGHRWFTAQGPFSGNTAELDIYWTTGMIFDSETPPRNQPFKDGTLTVEFEDCYTGTVSYEIESVSAIGEVPIERLANDAVVLCESLTDGPGKPGPL